jgi:hypothetical protein
VAQRTAASVENLLVVKHEADPRAWCVLGLLDEALRLLASRAIWIFDAQLICIFRFADELPGRLLCSDDWA